MTEEYSLFFKEHRIRSGFKSQRQLSDKSGVSQTTISRLERGDQKPSIETLKELTPYLTSTSYAEMLLACGYWDEDISDELEDLREDIKTKKFIKKLDFDNEEMFENTIEELLKEYKIRIGGENLSKEDAKKMINFIKEEKLKYSSNKF